MTRFGCVAGIQARMSSARLPGKVLEDLCGKPLIQRVYERTRAAALVDEAFVLTSTHESDDVLVARLAELAIPYRRGPLDDVLSRYLELAEERQPSFIVRVTGDCPFVEPDFIDLQLGALRALQADIVRVAGVDTSAIEGTLGGQSAFSARALRLVESSSDARDREHVGSFFFRRHAAQLKEVELEVDAAFEFPGLRLQVDEPADLEFARTVWSAVDHEGDGCFPLVRALRWIAAHPESRATNRHVQESADNLALRRLAREMEAKPSPMLDYLRRAARARDGQGDRGVA